MAKTNLTPEELHHLNVWIECRVLAHETDLSILEPALTTEQRRNLAKRRTLLEYERGR